MMYFRGNRHGVYVRDPPRKCCTLCCLYYSLQITPDVGRQNIHLSALPSLNYGLFPLSTQHCSTITGRNFFRRSLPPSPASRRMVGDRRPRTCDCRLVPISPRPSGRGIFFEKHPAFSGTGVADQHCSRQILQHNPHSRSQSGFSQGPFLLGCNFRFLSHNFLISRHTADMYFSRFAVSAAEGLPSSGSWSPATHRNLPCRSPMFCGRSRRC